MKIALLSAWNPYHAEEFVRSVRAIPGAELVCVWDDDAARGAAFAQRAGVPFCGDLAAALASYGARGAIINAAPWENAPLICAAAERGLHVLADKIPAMGKEQADMVARCVQAAPVVFAVAWPLLHRSYFQTARAVATSGALGKITMLRLRGAHGGGSGGTLPRRFYTKADGGVLTDLAFPLFYAAPWLLDEQPAAVTAVFSGVLGAAGEDNGAAVLRFPSGAVCVGESSYVSHASPFALELYGEGGTFLAGGADGGMRIDCGQGWQEAAPEPALPSPEADWVRAVREGNTPLFGLSAGLAAARMMDAAYASMREKRTIELIG